jgi:carboxyl-terminal processing protease
MFLVAHGDDLHRFTVLSVVDSGPAATAGIRPGDVITELDGQSTAKLTLEKLRASFRESGATRELTIDRQNERVMVKLQLRRAV